MHPKNLAITTLTTLAALSGCFEEPRTAAVTAVEEPVINCENTKKEIAKVLMDPDSYQEILTTKRQQDHATDESKTCQLNKQNNNNKRKITTTYTITCPDLYNQKVTYQADPDKTNTATTKLSIPTNENPIPVSLTRDNNELIFQVHSPEYWELVEEYNKNCPTEDLTP